MTLPQPGDRIRVAHWCGDARTGRVHDDPVTVERVVRLNTGRHRIETTRCDGGPMHVYDGADEWELESPVSAADTPEPPRVPADAPSPREVP